jgi:lipopolysaccharide/colanic/teichoic acid biosynthesis glycosyltransferase
MYNIKSKNVMFKIIPSGKDLILSKLHTKIDSINFIEIEYNINNKLNIFLKRTFDIFLSLIMLILVYPFVVIYYKLLRKDISIHVSKLLLLPLVFTGKLSFVGIPVWYDKNKENLGKKGLTGIVQLKYEENIPEEELDNYIIYYAKNQSLTLDFEILLKTLFSFINYRKNSRKNKL